MDIQNKNHCSWVIWRAISDRIIANPNYKYGAPRTHLPLLLNLSKFASEQMGRFNTLQWGPEHAYIFPHRFQAAHIRRVPNLPTCIYGWNAKNPRGPHA